MENTQTRTNEGIRRLVENGRKSFRIAENIEFYSEEDFKAAEKKFIKYCVIEQRCSTFHS